MVRPMSRAYRDLIAKTFDDRLGAPLQDYRGPLTEEKGGGLLRGGKRSLMHRVGFLMRSTSGDAQVAKVGKYLEGRRTGGGFGKFGKAGTKRRRVSPGYNSVYTNRTR